jgi:hypothetical protein
MEENNFVVVLMDDEIEEKPCVESAITATRRITGLVRRIILNVDDGFCI